MNTSAATTTTTTSSSSSSSRSSQAGAPAIRLLGVDAGSGNVTDNDTIDLGSIVVDVDWKLDAACRSQLELFFARKAERPEARARREAKAKRLCDACPVFAECRSMARANREYGYWAGENEEDRHLLGYRVSAPIGVRARLAEEEQRRNRSA